MENAFETSSTLKLKITGVVWTNKTVFTKNLPHTLEIEVDTDCFEIAKDEGTLSDFLKYEISECFVFSPIKLGKYKIL